MASEFRCRESLYDYVTLEQEAGERLSKLLDYAQRKSDEDTGVDTYQAMVGKAMSLSGLSARHLESTEGTLPSRRSGSSAPFYRKSRS